MGNLTMRRTAAVAVPAVVALAVSACGGSSGGASSSAAGAVSSATAAAGGATSGGGSGTIALLLPETKTTRYEAADRPFFEAKFRQLCPSCKVIYSNADQDASKQQSQADSALTNGAKVLVLDPVDSASAGSIVAKAKSRGVKVISYDRLITNADVDYYVSFDNAKVGQLQAQALTDKLKKDGKASGTIVMINGAPTDNNAKLFKQGAHSVIDKSGYKVGAEYDTPEWSPDNAQKEMDQAITKLGKSGFVGLYAANDGTAGGAIASMRRAGVSPSTIPSTGQDAELAAVQRIITGDQYMTVYKAIKPEADAAAQLAKDLLDGKTSSSQATGKVNNGQKDVPSVLLQPVAVTRDNVASTVVKDGYVKVTDLCSGSAATACATLGIK